MEVKKYSYYLTDNFNIIQINSSKLYETSVLYSIHKLKKIFSNFQKCQHYADDFESLFGE